MVISLPQSYSTLRTILMSSDDKLSTEAVIAQVLVEEKSRQATKSHSALAAKMTKKKSKPSEKKKTKKCTYAPCGLVGHTEEN